MDRRSLLCNDDYGDGNNDSDGNGDDDSKNFEVQARNHHFQHHQQQQLDTFELN